MFGCKLLERIVSSRPVQQLSEVVGLKSFASLWQSVAENQEHALLRKQSQNGGHVAQLQICNLAAVSPMPILQCRFFSQATDACLVGNPFTSSLDACPTAVRNESVTVPSGRERDHISQCWASCARTQSNQTNWPHATLLTCADGLGGSRNGSHHPRP